MRVDQLGQQPVQRVQPGGINYEPAAHRLVVWGIHGGGDFVTAIQVGATVLTRRLPDPITGAAAESEDALRARAMRDVVPTLPPDALRDSKGAAVGYFLYAGLPADHCKAVAEREGPL
jgi:hypothetical protein